ncbi:uncharacterized protein [Arachis hypogaea]|uniref:uncharacterized protein n=1 Tax=Arachis hypogaea TaxID=3818 RepID=UPI003B2247CD
MYGVHCVSHRIGQENTPPNNVRLSTSEIRSKSLTLRTDPSLTRTPLSVLTNTYSSVQGPANNITEVVPQNQLPSHCGSHRSYLTEKSSTIIGVQKRQSSSVVASVPINLAQLYEDVNLLTVKTHPPNGDTQSGLNVDSFVDDEVLNGYDDSMLDGIWKIILYHPQKLYNIYIYHSIGSLLPSDSLRPIFAQLYIYNIENEIDNRIGTLRSNEVINERDRKIVVILRNMLDKYNSLAKSFRYARDRYQQENCTNIKLKLISKRTTDGRTYNLPSASEMAALIVGEVEQLSKDRDIIIESQSRKLQWIDIFHPSYLALQYPLLFPYGEDVFRLGIATSDSISARPTKKNKTINLRQFFAFRLQKRTGESPLILRSKRLFQQFLVDAYTMVELERLKFFRCKQPQLRVDKYKCLHESLINGDVDVSRLGKRIILSNTFTGGPRYAGYPSYFITMTCNPEWDEIKREVTPIGLKAEDRPDILCRVFKIKFDDVCTVEFQKRGLSHAHILLFMSNEFKPQTPDDIDKHITAEIPDENERPNLHGAFQNYMVHDPCDPYNKNSPCMKNGSCSKFYPKEFRQQTLIDEAGFPKYRHTDNGRTVKKRECVLDNKFIVSYNPELLLKFGCHINVEYTCQTSSIKYLFKYVHKGNDRVTATLYNVGDSSKAAQVVDKIMNYYNFRYILACEAVWRLFGYEIQEKELFVIRLSFHLEDKQLVVYGEKSNVNDIIERTISHKSMFLGWMAANMSYPYARSLTYAEFPTKFVWKDDSSKWFSRKKSFTIGRLTHVPAELTMSDDEIKQLCLMDIDKILHSYGKTLTDYPPMPLAIEVDSSLLTERIIREELNFNRDDLKKNASDMLAIATPEQRYAFDKIVTAVYCDEGGFFFVYGHGVLKLTKNMRLSVGTTASDQDETEQFGEWLLKVGDGLIGDNMDENMSSKNFFKARTILASTLDIVEEINNHLMAIIPGGKKLYLSSDSIRMDEGNMESQLDLYGPELLNSINCSGLPPHKLILKVGVLVMLLRNIDQSNGQATS